MGVTKRMNEDVDTRRRE